MQYTFDAFIGPGHHPTNYHCWYDVLPCRQAWPFLADDAAGTSEAASTSGPSSSSSSSSSSAPPEAVVDDGKPEGGRVAHVKAWQL
jgi:hypothetical protein